MKDRLLHIFQNTPLGRETLLQSIHFCKTLNLSLHIYIPRSKRFLMALKSGLLSVDVDDSYLVSPETAIAHASELADEEGIRPCWVKPEDDEPSNTPKIEASFDYMGCPRSIRDLSSKIGLGYIGSRVRRIIQYAPFPVLIANSVYKPWQSIALFYNGSANDWNALCLGLELGFKCGAPIDLFIENRTEQDDNGGVKKVDTSDCNDIRPFVDLFCHVYSKKTFIDGLYHVPHDALVIIGAENSGLVRNFSSIMEKIQSNITNSLLIVGPNYHGKPMEQIMRHRKHSHAGAPVENACIRM